MSKSTTVQTALTPPPDISLLSPDLQKDADILTVHRLGDTEESYMRTDCYLGYAEPQKTYILNFDGMTETQNVSIKDLAPAHKPPLTRLKGEWQNAIDLTLQDANILGGNGRYILEDKATALKIAIAETTAEHLAYYDCHLVKIGEAVKFTTNANLPITITSVGKDYTEGYLLHPDKGGGSYLEMHDRPHFHMPLTENCRGYLVIGKRHKNGIDEVSAFKIPYGYGIHMAPWAIHTDAYLIGTYMVIYSATPKFSTVIVRQKTGDLAKILFEETQ